MPMPIPVPASLSRRPGGAVFNWNRPDDGESRSGFEPFFSDSAGSDRAMMAKPL